MKKKRIGVVGPEDTQKLVSQVLEHTKYNLEVIPLQYSSFEETIEIVKKYSAMVDIWLFTGEMTYNMVKEKGLIENGYFLELSGMSLSTVLLDIAYNFGHKLERVSFDTISENELLETYQDLSIESSQTQLLPFVSSLTHQEIVSFHTSLYEQKKVDVCVTALHSVYQELQKRQVPSFRLAPTRTSILRAFDRITKNGQLSHFKKAQIAVVMIQVDELFHLKGEGLMAYDVHQLNLKCQEIILDYTRKIFGSFSQKGVGTFTIFSTRGEIEANELSGLNLLEKLRILSNLTVSIGIGYGTTSFSAEKHASLAQYHAQQKNGNIIVTVDEQGKIHELSNQDTSFVYGYRTENEDLSNRLEKAGVNISTFNKLLYIQSQSSVSLTASSVAEQLEMTSRNARRILLGLEKHGLAKIIGQETPLTKGRPRSIYTILSS
ncbi:hypothetical protein BGM25_03500 [Bacillus sp. FJAT-29953]|nr:hypothetical protein [Bacillus sp. FJAT-29953]